MTALLTIARCLLLTLLSGAGGDGKDVDPVEIDFAPLPTAGPIDFVLDYTFTSHGDTFLTGVWHVTKETPSEVRDYFKERLEKEGWVVKAEGKTKLTLYSHNSHAPRKVEFKVDTFEFKPKGDVTPTVKRVKKA